jgi:hypothetical protein
MPTGVYGALAVSGLRNIDTGFTEVADCDSLLILSTPKQAEDTARKLLLNCPAELEPQPTVARVTDGG